MAEPGDSPPVTISVRDNGNDRIVGPIALLDGEGSALEVVAHTPARPVPAALRVISRGARAWPTIGG
jgi:hypothetical protein